MRIISDGTSANTKLVLEDGVRTLEHVQELQINFSAVQPLGCAFIKLAKPVADLKVGIYVIREPDGTEYEVSVKKVTLPEAVKP